MEKVRPWCGQPSDRGRLKNRTELYAVCRATYFHCDFSGWYNFGKIIKTVATSAPPDALAGFKGPTCKGKERKGMGKRRKRKGLRGGEGKGKREGNERGKGRASGGGGGRHSLARPLA